MYYIGLMREKGIHGYWAIGGMIETLGRAKQTFHNLRLELGVGFAPGPEMKCEVQINGEKYFMAVLDILGEPIEYTNFEEA